MIGGTAMKKARKPSAMPAQPICFARGHAASRDGGSRRLRRLRGAAATAHDDAARRCETNRTTRPWIM